MADFTVAEVSEIESKLYLYRDNSPIFDAVTKEIVKKIVKILQSTIERLKIVEIEPGVGLLPQFIFREAKNFEYIGYSSSKNMRNRINAVNDGKGMKSLNASDKIPESADILVIQHPEYILSSNDEVQEKINSIQARIKIQVVELADNPGYRKVVLSTGTEIAFPQLNLDKILDLAKGGHSQEVKDRGGVKYIITHGSVQAPKKEEVKEEQPKKKSKKKKGS